MQPVRHGIRLPVRHGIRFTGERWIRFIERDTRFGLRAEHEIDCEDHQQCGNEVVPAKLHTEGNHTEKDEDGQGDDLLNNLELHKVEGSAVA